jgi:hypothetical protein
LLPGRTGFGDAEFVTAKSDCPAPATTTVAVAELFVGFGSVVLEETVAVSEIVVPAASPETTFTLIVNVALVLAASDAIVQVILPVLPEDGVEQDQPGAGVIVLNVRSSGLAGIGMLSVMLLAADGPLLVTLTV